MATKRGGTLEESLHVLPMLLGDRKWQLKEVVCVGMYDLRARLILYGFVIVIVACAANTADRPSLPALDSQ